MIDDATLLIFIIFQLLVDILFILFMLNARGIMKLQTEWNKEQSKINKSFYNSIEEVDKLNLYRIFNMVLNEGNKPSVEKGSKDE